jgi:FkbM family methyltransferase
MALPPLLRRAVRHFAKPALETFLPWAERLTGFRTPDGDYLPYRLAMLLRRYELTELRLMQGFLAPGQTILDVGANVGYTTRFFAKQVGRSGRIHAFEPNPLIFPLLQKNVARFQNVEVYNLGLSTADGEIPLFLAGNNHFVGGFSPDYAVRQLAYGTKKSPDSVSAQVVQGDGFLRARGIERLDVVKIDVEGWELRVLSGLESIVSRSRTLVIFCELNPVAQECAGRPPGELVDWFFDRHFTITYANDGKLQSLSADSVDEIIARARASNHITLFARKDAATAGQA